MVVQTSSPFAPAKPRVPVVPRKISSGLSNQKPHTNKTHCPKCSSQLHRNYDDAECLNCGFVDYDYVPPVTKKKANSLCFRC